MRSDDLYRTAHKIKMHNLCTHDANPHVKEELIRFTPRLTSRRLIICRAKVESTDWPIAPGGSQGSEQLG